MRNRSAFSLVEVLIAVAILAIMAAVTVPTVVSRLNVARANALVKEMTTLLSGLQAFKTNVGDYPRYLDYLTALPSPVSSTETYCSQVVTSTNPFPPSQKFFITSQTNGWRGPYVSRVILSGSTYSVNDFTVNDQMDYVAPPPAGYLRITISGVDASVAPIIEELVDGPVVSGSYSSGSFTWDGSNTGFYRIAVATCP